MLSKAWLCGTVGTESGWGSGVFWKCIERMRQLPFGEWSTQMCAVVLSSWGGELGSRWPCGTEEPHLSLSWKGSREHGGHLFFLQLPSILSQQSHGEFFLKNFKGNESKGKEAWALSFRWQGTSTLWALKVYSQISQVKTFSCVMTKSFLYKAKYIYLGSVLGMRERKATHYSVLLAFSSTVKLLRIPAWVMWFSRE